MTAPVAHTSTLPYPWGDGPGLAPLLADAALWPLVIPDDVRWVIKSIRPRGAVGRRRLAVDDDPSFGAAVVTLIERPAARIRADQRFRALRKRNGQTTEIGLSEFLAEHLILWITGSLLSPCATFFADAVEPEIVASNLTPSRFRELLPTLPESLALDAAHLACAEGMLRPRDALAYAYALIEHSAGYEDLLFGQTQREETSGRGSSTTKPALLAVAELSPSEPVPTQSAANKPVLIEPAVNEPAAAKPTADETAPIEPAVDEPAAANPTADEPTPVEAAVNPTANEPSPTRPAANEPAPTKPIADEPAPPTRPTANEPAKAESQAPRASAGPLSGPSLNDLKTASSAASPRWRSSATADQPRPSLPLKDPEAEEQVRATDVLLAQGTATERPSTVTMASSESVELIAMIRLLAEQLGCTSTPPDPSSTRSEQAYLDDLRLIVMDLEEQLHERRATESTAAALADRIIAADPLTVTEPFNADQCAALLGLLGGARPKEPRAARWFDIAEDRLVVAMVAILAHTDSERAAQALSALPRPQRLRIVKELAPEHLAALLVPGTADIVSVEIVARIIAARGQTTLLDYLHPAPHIDSGELSPLARALLEACLAADKRGEPVDAILRALVVGQAQARSDRIRAQALSQIDQPPGMTGIYHRLRLSAQGRFLSPLRPHIAERRAADALRQFEAFGELESMVSLCVEDLTSNAVRAFGAQHFEQTRRYLANFRDILSEWAAGPQDPTKRPGAEELIRLWGELVYSRDSFAEELRVRVADPGATTALAPNVERWWYSEVGGALVVDESALAPRMLSSWVGAAAGDLIPLNAWSWDRARALLDAKWDAQRSVVRMIEARHYQAAQLAADTESSLARIVIPAVKDERDRLERKFEASLSRARGLRANTPEVDDYLASLEDALHALDFVEAELWLAGLDEHLLELALREDPEQREILEMLAEAGERRSVPRPTIEDLRIDVDRLREREGERRWHINVLEMIDQDLTSEQKDRLQGLAKALDRPSRWPCITRSKELGEAIESTLAYLHSHSTQWREYHDIDPDDVIQGLVELLERTLPGLPDSDDAARVVEIHGAINLHVPFMRVAELVSPGLRKSADEAYFERLRAGSKELIQRGEYGRALSDLRDVPDADAIRLRAELFDRLYRGTPLDIDWKALRGIIAQLRGHEGELGPSLLELDEIAQAIARIPSQNRPIDYLSASSAGADALQHRAALFVLSLHLKVALRRPPSEAVTLAMVLPEQIFRVWARWQLDLDPEQVPEGHSLTWRKVQALWDPDGRGNYMRIPAPGEKFPSFRCFAIFAQVEASTRRAPALEQTVNGLYAALRTLQVRHDGAHALAQTTAARRQHFFALVERWLDQLYSACPANVRREEIEALFDPQD